MRILDFFLNKKEERRKIGEYECDSLALSNAFVSLMNKIGASNPTSVQKSTKQVVSIRKKGDRFILTLNSFTPPIEIQWTGLFPYNQLGNILNQVADRKGKVGYINTTATEAHGMQFQLALA